MCPGRSAQTTVTSCPHCSIMRAANTLLWLSALGHLGIVFLRDLLPQGMVPASRGPTCVSNALRLELGAVL